MQTPQQPVETTDGSPRKISRAARRRVHAREHRVRRTQKAARAQLPVW
jgi:hypothetical protein